tara:strand:+ start:185 stop:442 length:258 start_codon:yes stop_codon:yes gene_type:complete
MSITKESEFIGIQNISEVVGKTETEAIQLVIEYEPNPIYDSGSISKASKEVIKIAEIKLAKDVKKEIKLMDLLKAGKPLIKESIK